MNKHFLKAFILYNWPAILWLLLCATMVWEHTQIPDFDDKTMPLLPTLNRLRDMFYGVRWGYAGLLGVIYMFFTYTKVAAKTIDDILREEDANKNRPTKS